jgi:hypothetical protein
MTRPVRTIAVSLWVVLIAATVTAQDLEPRAYSPSPVGTTFLVAGLGRSTGGIVTDPTLPIDNVDGKLNSATLGLGHSFGILGRQAIVLMAVPYTWGRFTGEVFEVHREITRAGLADPRIKVSVGLIGMPALSPAAFARAPRRTIVGVSLTAVPPIGQYDRTRLINLGTNRWSFKPEIGISYPAGRWLIDGYVGASLFATNEEFFPGTNVRTQDPVVGVQGHVSYTFPIRAWLAFDATWYQGGRTTINGVRKADLLKNTRLGTVFSIPLPNRQSIKFAYTTGAATSIGADFDTFSLAWQMVFF